MSETAKSGKLVAYLLGEMDDNPDESTGEDAEHGKDGAVFVDPHELGLSL
jgi:hypothetical protein